VKKVPGGIDVAHVKPLFANISRNALASGSLRHVNAKPGANALRLMQSPPTQATHGGLAVPTLPSRKLPVVVTGNSGLIGTALVDALLQHGPVIGLDIAPPPARHEASDQFDWVKCDFTDDRAVLQAMRAIGALYDRIASIVHLAAYYDFSGEPSPLYDELTVQGTRRLLQATQPLAVEQIIFSSTLLAMQPAELGTVLTEASPTQAEWDYPQSKLDAEDLLLEHHGSIPLVLVRMAGVYDSMCHSVPIAQQIRRIYEKDFESYFFPGNPEHGQSFIHLDDLVDCLVRMVEARHTTLAPEEVLLLGEPEVLGYGELQEIIGRLIHGQGWPTIRVPKVLAKAGAWVKDSLDDESFIKPWMIDLADGHYPVDPSKARMKLGWTPRHTLRDTLPTMIQNLLADPAAWYEANNLPEPD